MFNKQKVKNWLVTVWPVFSFQFFQYRAIPLVILKMTGFVSSLLLFLLTLKKIFTIRYRCGSIPFYFKTIICLTLLSFLTAYVVWDQPFPNTFRSSIGYFNLCFFFLLMKYNISEKTLMRCTIIYTVIVIILWTYAIGQAPTIVFGHLGDDDSMELVNNRGNFRINILGQRFSLICLFYFLMKALNGDKNKILYYLLSFGLFVFNCTDLTRSNMTAIVIGVFALFYMCNKSKLKFVAQVTIICLLAAIVMWSLFGEQIEELSELTQSQFQGGAADDDGLYRVKEYIFFFTEFKNNLFTILFGNGLPNSSSYQVYVNQMQDKGYYLVDVSWAYIFITLGLVGLFSYIGLVYKMLSSKVNSNVLFAKAYIVYAIVANITVTAMMDSIPLAVCAYLIYKNTIPSQKISRRY